MMRFGPVVGDGEIVATAHHDPHRAPHPTRGDRGEDGVLRQAEFGAEMAADELDKPVRGRNIGANRVWRTTPIVRQALALGASGYVTKASDPAFLVEAVLRAARGEQVLSPELAAGLDALGGEAPHHQLTAREFEVFLRLARGEPLDAIAQALRLSAKTVANLQTAVRARLRLDSPIALHRYAREHRLID